jgi:hypothetical protein
LRRGVAEVVFQAHPLEILDGIFAAIFEPLLKLPTERVAVIASPPVARQRARKPPPMHWFVSGKQTLSALVLPVL